jgi:hypothetical protein
MENSKILGFIISLIFKDWGNAISYASLIGIIGCLVFTENNK